MWVKAFPTALSAVVIEPDRTIHYSSPNDTVNGETNVSCNHTLYKDAKISNAKS